MSDIPVYIEGLAREEGFSRSGTRSVLVHLPVGHKSNGAFRLNSGGGGSGREPKRRHPGDSCTYSDLVQFKDQLKNNLKTRC